MLLLGSLRNRKLNGSTVVVDFAFVVHQNVAAK